jgi:serine/threonine protein kinase
MLIDKGTYGCIYHPGIQCAEKNMASKVVNYKNSHRELEICKIIKKIPQYKKHFIPIETSCTVSSKKVKACKILAPEKTFVVMNMPFKKTLPEKVGIEHYVELVTSIDLLLKYKVVHFDIKYENIIFTPKPLLIDFGISLNMHTLTLKSFYFYRPEYFMWPIDVHLLGYKMNVSDVFTTETLTKVCKDVYNKSPYLHNVEECIKHYSYLLTFTPEEATAELIKGWKTWDLYSATVLLFKNLHSDVLVSVFHCNPSKRLTVKEVLTTRSFISPRLSTSANSSCVARNSVIG